jgi:hypothetical protein
MKIIEFLQKIGITNFGPAAEGHCGAGDTPDQPKTEVNKSKKDDSTREDPDPSPV